MKKPFLALAAVVLLICCGFAGKVYSDSSKPELITADFITPNSSWYDILVYSVYSVSFNGMLPPTTGLGQDFSEIEFKQLANKKATRRKTQEGLTCQSVGIPPMLTYNSVRGAFGPTEVGFPGLSQDISELLTLQWRESEGLQYVSFDGGQTGYTVGVTAIPRLWFLSITEYGRGVEPPHKMTRSCALQQLSDRDSLAVQAYEAALSDVPSWKLVTKEGEVLFKRDEAAPNSSEHSFKVAGDAAAQKQLFDQISARLLETGAPPWAIMKIDVTQVGSEDEWVRLNNIRMSDGGTLTVIAIGSRTDGLAVVARKP